MCIFLSQSKRDLSFIGGFACIWMKKNIYYQKSSLALFLSWCHLTWDQALFYFLIFFFASLLLWLEREKNNAWYIYLTSRQPPPNLHNLTSAWPVMLLANKRLPYGNQILARIMSLLKSILGKRKFLSTSMFRWRFLKKIFNVLFLWWNIASWSCRTFI